MQRRLTRTLCFLAVFAFGCAADVRDVGQSSHGLVGGADHYDCEPHGREDSLCFGNGITFLSRDLKLIECNDTRSGPVCLADPADSPDMPPEFWSGPGTAIADCPEGTWLTCEYVGNNVECWCAASGGGGGMGGSDDGTVVFEIVE